MAQKKNIKLVYVEPEDYIPKEIWARSWKKVHGADWSGMDRKKVATKRTSIRVKTLARIRRGEQI